MKSAARIDVHQHIVPPEFVEVLAQRGMSAWAYPKWSSDSALAVMDENQIATGILSLSAPGPHFGDDAEARTLVRQVNERIASLVKMRPDRFGMFASVPLPDIDGSIEAIRYAYDELRTDGVVLFANSRGIYLGDPAFDPVMEELNRRAAVIFVHPSMLPGPPIAGINPAIADFLLDTTRAAVNLVLKGIPKRYPKLRIILAHAGGFLPYAAHRIAMTSSLIDGNITLPQMLDDLSSFYFDTALSAPSALPSLLAFAKRGRVLFGSDSPYASDSAVNYFTDHLDTYSILEQQDRDAINHKTARSLFSRLA